MTVCTVLVAMDPFNKEETNTEFRFTCPIQMERFLTLCEAYGVPVVSTTIKDYEGVLS